MKAGKLRYFIIIEELHTEKNEFGEEQNSEYSEKLRTRADIVNDSGNRVNDNGEIFYSYQKTFIVWDYFDDLIKETDRIIYKENKYRIITKDLDRENKLLYVKTELINE